MSTNMEIHVRPASIQDKEFILSLLPRLEEFGPPPWRDATQMLVTDIQVLSDVLMNKSWDSVIFIADDDQSVSLGFIHLQTGKDYYYHEAHAHISNIIVAPEGEGRGIGRVLIEKGEEWARSQGFRWLTLIWELIALLPGCLALAFAAYKSKSTWPGIIAHLASSLPTLIFIMVGILG